ncbi:MAG: hypothetical protein ACTSRG_07805 [Candidatus Helarchaeota archaeon]
MIAAMAKAARVFDEFKYIDEAKKATDFILKKLLTSEGILLHRFRDGEAAILGNLNDYAFLIWGLLEMYVTSFDTYYLKIALELNNVLLKQFWDSRNGGFYFTPNGGEELLFRKKEIYDGAIPSGNSVAMLNLLRLSRITGNTEFEESAAQIPLAFSNQVRSMPSAYTNLMIALDFAIVPSYEVVIAGNSNTDDTKAMLNIIRKNFIPNMVVILNPAEEKQPPIFKISEFIKNQKCIEGKTTAYVCSNFICKSPTTETEKLLELLKGQKI